MYVYFIRSYCKKYIKIGTTKSLKRRFEELQTANPMPLKLLGFIPGGFDTEATLHLEFSKQRKSGEWFRNVGDVKALQKILTCPEIVPFKVQTVKDIQRAIRHLRVREAANRQKSGVIKKKIRKFTNSNN